MPNGRGTAALAMTPQIHRPAQCRLFSCTPPAGHTSAARLIGGPMRPQRLRHQCRPAARLKVDQGGRSSDPLLPWFDTAPAAAALPPVQPPPLRHQHNTSPAEGLGCTQDLWHTANTPCNTRRSAGRESAGPTPCLGRRTAARQTRLRWGERRGEARGLVLHQPGIRPDWKGQSMQKHGATGKNRTCD